jgi:hypothetical protein
MTNAMRELFDQYPQCLEELQYQVARSDLEYADSFRMCFEDDAFQKRDYHKAVSCCGTREFRMKVDGRYVLLGCNYGH